MSEDSVRSYRDGDEQMIVRLFSEVFGLPKSLSRWRWQFREHPQGAGWITLAESCEGDIVAQYCVMRNNLNLGGRQIEAVQSCDTMVREDQRGKKWFVRLARPNYDEVAAIGIKAVFGFPNQNSFPGFARSLEWERIAALTAYTLRLGGAKAWGGAIDFCFKQALVLRESLRARLLRISSPAVTISQTVNLPIEVEGLFD
jgi:hypothetical protein